MTVSCSGVIGCAAACPHWRLGVGVGVGSGVGVEVGSGEGVRVGSGVGVEVGSGVGVGVGSGVGVGVGSGEGVGVGSGVGVEVGSGVGVGIDSGVGVAAGSGASVAVGVGAGSQADSSMSSAITTITGQGMRRIARAAGSIAPFIRFSPPADRRRARRVTATSQPILPRLTATVIPAESAVTAYAPWGAVRLPHRPTDRRSGG